MSAIRMPFKGALWAIYTTIVVSIAGITSTILSLVLGNDDLLHLGLVCGMAGMALMWYRASFAARVYRKELENGVAMQIGAALQKSNADFLKLFRPSDLLKEAVEDVQKES